VAMLKRENCGSTTKGSLIGKLKIVPEYWNVPEHKTFTQQKRFSFVLCKVIYQMDLGKIIPEVEHQRGRLIG